MARKNSLSLGIWRSEEDVFLVSRCSRPGNQHVAIGFAGWTLMMLQGGRGIIGGSCRQWDLGEVCFWPSTIGISIRVARRSAKAEVRVSRSRQSYRPLSLSGFEADRSLAQVPCASVKTSPSESGRAVGSR